MTNFELAVRVPLLMRVPWRPGSIGRRYAKATYYLLTTYGLLRTTCYRSARIVEIVSLYQTIAELAGLPPPAERLQGKSFASTFGAEAAAGQAGLAAAAAAAGGGAMAGRTAAGAGAGRAEVEMEAEAEQYAFSQFAKQNVTASELPGRPLVPLGSAWSKVAGRPGVSAAHSHRPKLRSCSIDPPRRRATDAQMPARGGVLPDTAVTLR